MRLRRFWVAVAAITLVACSGETADEEIRRDDEVAQAARGVENFQKLLAHYKTTHVARGAHAKGHACLKAEFSIDSSIDAHYQHGVFAMPGARYQAWVRFSNGHFDLSVSRDGERDARGLAIKVLDPPGEPLQRDTNGTATQDFLLTNSPVFFATDISDYNELIAAPEEFLGYFFPTWWDPRSWRIAELRSAIRILSTTPGSLLDERYFSVTPYQLGPHVTKYVVRPCETASPVAPPEPIPDNYLAEELGARLSQASACFEFAVQPHRPGVGLSIEDPTVEWPESVAPPVRVATLRLPRQSMEPGSGVFCENLAFAPWHALPEHRPLGQFNRLRRHVYPASSAFRHEANNTEVPAALRW